ncbi:MAG: flagellar basal body P-ring formation protein FlgA [Pirellulales bacterium]|nr:flagellar basal body P-ring formation protein FlgA [Pirellulales bacterium]
MHVYSRQLATTLAALFVLGAPLAVAAEIRLRRDCVPATSLVTLADVADIHAADGAEADTLGNIPLFAAPAAGKNRFLPIRELQDLLLLRGVNLTGHTLSGASQAVIHTPIEPKAMPQPAAPPAPAERPIARHERDRAVEQITDALIDYLTEQAGAAAWQVKVSGIQGELRPFLAASVDHPLAVSGGTAPWVGVQKFTVRRSSEEGETSVSVSAEVSLPAMILAVSRTLPRGSIVQASDLQFQPRRSNDTNIVGLEIPEDAIGRQVTRSIPAGAVLAASDLREPIVVRRGDAVTVYSRAPGIRVRTTARSKQDGGIGDLIEVESFGTRSTFFARVSGVQEVEVFAQAVSMPRSAAAPLATTATTSATTASATTVLPPPATTVPTKTVGWRRSTASQTPTIGE